MVGKFPHLSTLSRARLPSPGAFLPGVPMSPGPCGHPGQQGLLPLYGGCRGMAMAGPVPPLVPRGSKALLPPAQSEELPGTLVKKKKKKNPDSRRPYARPPESVFREGNWKSGLLTCAPGGFRQASLGSFI